MPTLVLHRTDDQCLTVEEGRYVAEHIPGATFVELPGNDHLPFVGDQDAMLDAIEPFLDRLPHDGVADRVLATILSPRVSPRGDQTPARDAFDAHARREIEWFRGRWLDRCNEGLTAAFDGPARAIRCAVVAGRRRAALRVDGARRTPHRRVQPTTARTCAGRRCRLPPRSAAWRRPGEVLVSRTVKDLVAGAGLFFDDRGTHALDVDGQTWRVFAARAAGLSQAAGQTTR